MTCWSYICYAVKFKSPVGFFSCPDQQPRSEFFWRALPFLRRESEARYFPELMNVWLVGRKIFLIDCPPVDWWERRKDSASAELRAGKEFHLDAPARTREKRFSSLPFQENFVSCGRKFGQKNLSWQPRKRKLLPPAAGRWRGQFSFLFMIAATISCKKISSPTQ